MTNSQLTEALLSRYERCRDSDSELMIAMLQARGADLSPSQRDVVRSINFESIRRHRQSLQAQGMYPATSAVARKRKQKANDVRAAIPFDDPALTTRLIEQPAVDWRSVFLS